MEAFSKTRQIITYAKKVMDEIKTVCEDRNASCVEDELTTEFGYVKFRAYQKEYSGFDLDYPPSGMDNWDDLDIEFANTEIYNSKGDHLPNFSKAVNKHIRLWI